LTRAAIKKPPQLGLRNCLAATYLAQFAVASMIGWHHTCQLRCLMIEKLDVFICMFRCGFMSCFNPVNCSQRNRNAVIRNLILRHADGRVASRVLLAALPLH